MARAKKGDYVVRAACVDDGDGSTSVKITVKIDAPKGSGEASLAKTITLTCDGEPVDEGLPAGVDGFNVSLLTETQDDSVRGYAILVRTPLS